MKNSTLFSIFGVFCLIFSTGSLKAQMMSNVPQDFMIENHFGHCGALAEWESPQVQEGVQLTSDFHSGDEFQVGTTTVTYTAFDSQGNQESASFNVTVLDSENPVTNCRNFDLILNEQGVAMLYPEDINDGVFDNCGIAYVELSRAEFTSEDLGENYVTLFATDYDGNSSTCTSVVTVMFEETQGSGITPNSETLADIMGECEVQLMAPTATAHNGAVLVATTETTSFNSQGYHEVVWTYTDSQGNTETQTQTVIISDETAPETPELPDVVGEFQVELSTPATFDECSGMIVGTTTDPVFYDMPGTYAATWAFMDDNGNFTSAVQLVTVEGSSIPFAFCQDVSVPLDNSGNAVIDALDIDNGSYSQAAFLTYEVSRTEFSCDDIGSNYVVLTVTDAEGMSSSCQAEVMVIDVISPHITVLESTVEIEIAEGEDMAYAHFDQPEVMDNCSVASYSFSMEPGTELTEGQYQVFVTAEDYSGNVTVEDFMIIVNAPEIQINNPSSGFEILEITFDFYPNPADEDVVIDTDFESIFTVDVTDLSGRVVYSNDQVLNKTSIDVSGLSTGVYMLTANLGGEIITKKVIVK